MSEHRKIPPEAIKGQSVTIQHPIGEKDANFGLFGKSIFQSLPIGIVTFDGDLKIIEANTQAGNLLALDERIDKALAGGSNNPATAGQSWTEQLRSVIDEGKSYNFDSINYTKKNKTRLLQIICIPLREAETQNILGGTIIIEDITEQAKIQQQLATTERLATVGKLASKVAHELNNPLDGILRYINLAIRTVEQENLEKPKEYLNQCRRGLMRMVQIVSELLEFSRSTYRPFEYVRIEQIIDDAIKTMEAGAEAANVRIITKYHPATPRVRMGNLFQVFCNLIKNAIAAMPNGGELKISTCFSQEQVVVAEFRDTGTGFPPEHAHLLFEPFFTTKEKGKGTGLGLAICKDIVERYEGHITAENAPGGGSIFTVWLPIKPENEHVE